jgi:hypothetical protein
VAAQIALSVDALDGETGQILHCFSSPSGIARREKNRQTPYRPKNLVLRRIVLRAICGVKKKRHNM